MDTASKTCTWDKTRFVTSLTFVKGGARRAKYLTNMLKNPDLYVNQQIFYTSLFQWQLLNKLNEIG